MVDLMDALLETRMDKLWVEWKVEMLEMTKAELTERIRVEVLARSSVEYWVLWMEKQLDDQTGMTTGCMLGKQKAHKKDLW